MRKSKKETIITRECPHLKMNMLLKLLWALVEKNTIFQHIKFDLKTSTRLLYLAGNSTMFCVRL